MNRLIPLVIILGLLAGCASNREIDKPIGPDPAIGDIEIQGEVRHPGIYPFRSGMKVIDLVTDAGGLTDFGSGIKVIRRGELIIDVYEGHRGTRVSKFMNARLTAGDVVRIGKMRY